MTLRSVDPSPPTRLQSAIARPNRRSLTRLVADTSPASLSASREVPSNSALLDDVFAELTCLPLGT
ncbi:MAG UNVERIFIED_CONTAM: hypothetical protein LVR18_50290 [Planctomycetaceae bacterium]